MRGHKYSGSIKRHLENIHNINSPDLDMLLNSTKILYFCDNRRNLPVFEALFIKKFKPTLNENTRDFDCLRLNIG